jgi:hypothetical protein
MYALAAVPQVLLDSSQFRSIAELAAAKPVQKIVREVDHCSKSERAIRIRQSVKTPVSAGKEEGYRSEESYAKGDGTTLFRSNLK